MRHDETLQKPGIPSPQNDFLSDIYNLSTAHDIRNDGDFPAASIFQIIKNASRMVMTQRIENAVAPF